MVENGMLYRSSCHTRTSYRGMGSGTKFDDVQDPKREVTFNRTTDANTK